MGTKRFRAWDEDKRRFLDLGEGTLFDINLSEETNFDESVFYLQYTDLKDKAGKEIWEGDIVKTEDEYLGKVIFDKGEYKIETYSGEKHPISAKELILMGNIFEDSELMNIIT
jgi:hypothetical protein